MPLTSQMMAFCFSFCFESFGAVQEKIGPGWNGMMGICTPDWQLAVFLWEFRYRPAHFERAAFPAILVGLTSNSSQCEFRIQQDMHQPIKDERVMVVRQKEQADGDLSLIEIPSKCVLFDRYMSAFCRSLLFEFHDLYMYLALKNLITTSPILNCNSKPGIRHVDER